MQTATPIIDAMKENDSWNDDWNDAADMDANWLEDYLKAGAAVWRNGVLDQKTIEFIAIAVNASCTHMYAPGVRRHIANALDLGATQQEILTVLQAVTAISIHSVAMSAPILVEEVSKRTVAQNKVSAD